MIRGPNDYVTCLKARDSWGVSLQLNDDREGIDVGLPHRQIRELCWW